jgi:Asp-tRNA(Asn)/Glu-tRNA(Gln) amidotransferase A subunit family amidase
MMLERAKLADQKYANGTAGSLEGLPFAFKDNIAFNDEPCSGCTPAFWGRIPKDTAEVAKRLLGAGVIPSGRTIMHELAYGITSNNAFTGSPRNFYNREFSCGGSSGGSGGVVGADIVPASLGTDTGGSIRIPASTNGVFGYKPTIDRWPQDYGILMTKLRDTVGPMARSMEDIVMFDNIVTGNNTDIPNPKDVRIGVPRSHYWEKLDPDVAQQGEEFLVRLKVILNF